MMDTSFKVVQVRSPAMMESSLETGGMQGQIYKQHYVLRARVLKIITLTVIGAFRALMAYLGMPAILWTDLPHNAVVRVVQMSTLISIIRAYACPAIMTNTEGAAIYYMDLIQVVSRKDLLTIGVTMI
jgi:hypothetical protein